MCPAALAAGYSASSRKNADLAPAHAAVFVAESGPTQPAFVAGRMPRECPVTLHGPGQRRNGPTDRGSATPVTAGRVDNPTPAHSRLASSEGPQRAENVKWLAVSADHPSMLFMRATVAHT